MFERPARMLLARHGWTIESEFPLRVENQTVGCSVSGRPGVDGLLESLRFFEECDRRLSGRRSPR
jgi:hypothetical protein